MGNLLFSIFKKKNQWNVKFVQHLGTLYFLLFLTLFFFSILCNVEMAVTALLLVLPAQIIGTCVLLLQLHSI